MHDASDGSQVRSCSGEPPPSDQYLGARVRTVTMTAWARAALDDHRGGETVVRRGSPPNHGPFGERYTASVPACVLAGGSRTLEAGNFWRARPGTPRWPRY